MDERNEYQLIEAIRKAKEIEDIIEYLKRFPGKRPPIWDFYLEGPDQFAVSVQFSYDLHCEFNSIHWDVVNGVFHGDQRQTDQFCIIILEALVAREKLVEIDPHAVSSKSAIGNHVVDFCVCLVLESFCYHGRVPSAAFQALVSYHNGMKGNRFYKKRFSDNRKIEIALFMRDNPDWSLRRVAKYWNVDFSTILKWKNDPVFRDFTNSNKN
ncbi:hypothetical protein [Roseibium sp.]|uniref:hypothetical protein n=1 Tax=Roseibium sp. TaxID=1936156 RepID=UPI0039F134AE